MAGPSLSFEVIDEGTRLRMLRSQLHDPRFVLEGIGALLEGVSADAFQDEKLGPVRWKKRSETGMVPNWPGILGHFAEKAGDPPNRFFGDRETLTSTGHLRGSIRSRVVNQNTVEVGTRVHYASVLHTGGESKTARITERLQTRLWEWMKGQGVGSAGRRRRFESKKGKILSTSKKMQKIAEDRVFASMSGSFRRAQEGLGRLMADVERKEARLGRSVRGGHAYKQSRRGYTDVMRQERKRIRKSLRSRPSADSSKESRMKESLRSRFTGARGEARDAVKQRVKAELGRKPAQRSGKRASMASTLGWLLNPGLRGQHLTVTHPARPIVGVPKTLVADVQTIYGGLVESA